MAADDPDRGPGSFPRPATRTLVLVLVLVTGPVPAQDPVPVTVRAPDRGCELPPVLPL
ncbi:hypothetical protein [Streptomyces jumonjinensis]|uniref:hypothetical protein n=1 Tax=Streptomyces jumonjinensis TaxID=1945 RepID=UPI00378E9985